MMTQFPFPFSLVLISVITGKPFILWSKNPGQSQKQCWHGSLHSCECWLLLVTRINHSSSRGRAVVSVYACLDSKFRIK